MSLRRLFQSRPYQAPTVRVNCLPVSKRIEEECTPHYSSKHFYPMRLYEVLNNRYQVFAKLGWGTSSTVWLARDLYQYARNVKVNANNYATRECAEKGRLVTEHITRADPQHIGRDFVNTMLDSFDLVGPGGTHVCMVFEPLCEPLWMLKQRFQRNVLPVDVLKPVSRMLIEGLRYLHTRCHIIHTDLKSDNVLMALRDQSVLYTVAQDEMRSPLPQKKLEDRTIYMSRNDLGFQPKNLGGPVITDFGLAVRGDEPCTYNHPIQPDGYQAPEVVLRAGWSYSVDIWNLGTLIWDLLRGNGPFDPAQSGTSTFSEEMHLACIISILGPPPLDILHRGKESSRYFDDEGKFKFPELVREGGGFEATDFDLEGNERQMFLNFISRMLQWRPEDRSSAGELLSDPWLQI